MKFDDLVGNIEIMAYNLKEREINPEDVDVVFTKSSGETIIALVYNDDVVDYMKG